MASSTSTSLCASIHGLIAYFTVKWVGGHIRKCRRAGRRAVALLVRGRVSTELVKAAPSGIGGGYEMRVAGDSGLLLQQ
jgi:hypothetical protein